MATARTKAREARRWKEHRPTTKDVTKVFCKYCDAVNKVVKERIDAMWDTGLSKEIARIQQAQLEDNRKRSQEIDNLDTTVTPKLMYAMRPASYP
jgi:tRNA A37 N6-isopentenylltransferase MiaA